MQLLSLKTSCSLSVLMAATLVVSVEAKAACTPSSGTGSDDVVVCSGTSSGLDLLTGNDTLTNTGTINGDVNLGNGDGNVTNSGTIISTSVSGISFNLGTHILNNTGVISAPTEYGADFNGIATVTNSGTIESTSGGYFTDAIRFTQIGDRTGETIVVNNQVGGIITNTANSPSASGIEVAGGGGTLDSIVITNAGTINAAGRGIRFEAINFGTSIINNTGILSGLGQQAIFIDGGSADTITNSGTISGDIALDDGNDTLTNTGNITGDIDFGSGEDRFNLDLDTGSFNGLADGGTHTTGDIVTINSSLASATIDLNNFINFEDATLLGNQTITTTGTASFETVTLDDQTNLTVATGSSLTATMGLTGTTENEIIIDAGGALIADATFGAGNDVFTNNGTFTGNLDLGLGNDTFTNSGTSTGDVTSSAGTNSFNFNAGTLIGDLNLDTGTDTVNFNGGDVTGNVFDSDLTSGLSSAFVNNDTTVTGDVTVNTLQLNPGSTLMANALNVDNLIAHVETNTRFGSAVITGGPVDLDGLNISALIGGAVTDDSEINILSGTGPVVGLDGNPGQSFTNIEDTSLLFNFGIADGSRPEVTSSTDNSSVFLVLDKVAQIRDVVRTENEANVGDVLEVLETIPPGINSPEMQAIFGQMNSASDTEALSDVLKAAIPAVDGGSFSAAQNVTGNTLRLVSDRLTVIRHHGGVNRQSGVSSGDVTENLQMWGQVFGQKIDQGQREDIAGFDATTRGLTVGVDTESLIDDATVGVAFSYANTDVSSDSVNNTQTEINSYNMSLYGDYDLTDTTYLVGDIGYTYGDSESTRFNVGGVSGLNAESDYGSHQFEARAIAAHDYYPEQFDGIHITPKIQAHYIRFQNEDISETGAGGAGLNIDSEALDILEFGAGLDVRKDYKQDNGGILSPEASVGYRYDVIGEALQTTSTFSAGGPSFKSEGAAPDQATLNLGVGIGYTSPTNMEFTASYDYESKDEFNSHSALIRLAAPF